MKRLLPALALLVPLAAIAPAGRAGLIAPPPAIVAMWDGKDGASVRATLLGIAALGEPPGASARQKLESGEAAWWLGVQDEHAGRADSALAQWRRAVAMRGDFDEGFALDPDRVRHAMTPRTKVIVITSPHNPTAVSAAPAALEAIGRVAEGAGAHVIVDEVYKDLTGDRTPPAAARGDVFVTTNSLTKSYGLSSLRAGWVIASPALSYRVRRARDVVDGSGSIVAERLATLAFQHLDALTERARTILARNKALADAFLQSRVELEWVPSAGTIVFPRIRGTADSQPFVERLMRERKTALGPGFFFQAPAHFRLGYGGDAEKIRQGLAHVGAALDGMGEGV